MELIIRTTVKSTRILVILISLFGGICAGCGSPQYVTDERDQPSVADQDGLEITAHWAKFGDSTYEFGTKWETLMQLEPEQLVKSYSNAELSVLIPPDDLKFGNHWKIDTTKVIPFLKQFHLGATDKLHHRGPEGAYGCVIAENDSFRRIRIRMHAEFKLKDGIYLPSQFAGDFIVDRSTGNLVGFRFGVPPRRNNVDLNWEIGGTTNIKGPGGKPMLDEKGKPIAVPLISADIGYCERMELVGGDWGFAKKIRWDHELPEDDVDRLLQKRFYRFASIDWLPWEEAVAKSQETGKPLHVVALFGSLDDESC